MVVCVARDHGACQDCHDDDDDDYHHDEVKYDGHSDDGEEVVNGCVSGAWPGSRPGQPPRSLRDFDHVAREDSNNANMPHLTTYRSLWTDLDKKVGIGMNITMQF